MGLKVDRVSKRVLAHLGLGANRFPGQVKWSDLATIMVYRVYASIRCNVSKNKQTFLLFSKSPKGRFSICPQIRVTRPMYLCIRTCAATQPHLSLTCGLRSSAIRGWLATADHHCYRCLRILSYIFCNPILSDIMADYSCFRNQVVVITGKLKMHFVML